MNTSASNRLVTATTDAAAFGISEHVSREPVLLVARLLPLIPPVGLLAAIYAFAVNVPYGSEWDLIPIVAHLEDRTLSWAQFASGSAITGARIVTAALASPTKFNVTTHMYLGFGFQFLAFIFLWSVLELTLRAWHRRLIFPLSITLGLLMFPLVNNETLLSGLTSLQWGVGNFLVAVTVWLLARWPRMSALAVCLFVSCIGTLGFPSGMVLWALVLASIVTRSLMEHRVKLRQLAAWGVGTCVLAGVYVSGFARMAERPQWSVLLAHPLQSCAFVLAYLGSPLMQHVNVWVAAAGGLAGLVFWVCAVRFAKQHRLSRRAMQPWVWLCSYALLTAVVSAANHLEKGVASALTDPYPAASFFWIGFIVTAAVAFWTESAEQSSGSPWVRKAFIAAVIAVAITYVWHYQQGYVAFAQSYAARTVGLTELYEYDAEASDIPMLLNVDESHLREYLHVLKERRIGPFSPRMSAERGRLLNAMTVSTNVAAQGFLDLATCYDIAGWAWDPQQRDALVRVDIYDGEVLLVTTLANRFREDLLKPTGNGRHGFNFRPPSPLNNGPHTIHVRVTGTKDDVNGSPAQFVCQ
jgi:hypothetical protein